MLKSGFCGAATGVTGQSWVFRDRLNLDMGIRGCREPALGWHQEGGEAAGAGQARLPFLQHAGEPSMPAPTLPENLWKVRGSNCCLLSC